MKAKIRAAEKEAKEYLENIGYQTYNLWHVQDVQSKFNCTDEEAMEVLIKALTNDATMEQIWLAIEIEGENLNLKE